MLKRYIIFIIISALVVGITLIDKYNIYGDYGRGKNNNNIHESEIGGKKENRGDGENGGGEDEEVGLTDTDRQMLDIMEEQGIDTTKIEDNIRKSVLESGGVILGGALPAKEYKTLASAEQQFGTYFGLHNKLDSIENCELSKLFIINEDTMNAIYDIEYEEHVEKTMIIKLTIKNTLESLIDVYKENKYSSKGILDIGGIDVTIEGIENIGEYGEVNLAYFEADDGRKYSIHSESGIELEKVKLVLNEIIENVKMINSTA